MGIKQRRFPKNRLYVITQNLNERLARQFGCKEAAWQHPVVPLSWNKAMKNAVRYLRFLCHEKSLKHDGLQMYADWKYLFKDIQKSFNRRFRSLDEEWQKQIFRILEKLNQPATPPKDRRDPRWQAVASFLTSGNYFYRRKISEALDDEKISWSTALPKVNRQIAGLRQAKLSNAQWLITLHVINGHNFRSRKNGWAKMQLRANQRFLVCS